MSHYPQFTRRDRGRISRYHRREPLARSLPLRVYCAAILLDHLKGLPSASLAESLHPLADGNFLWRARGSRAQCSRFLPADVERTRAHEPVRALGGRAAARASATPAEIIADIFFPLTIEFVEGRLP